VVNISGGEWLLWLQTGQNRITANISPVFGITRKFDHLSSDLTLDLARLGDDHGFAYFVLEIEINP
jgi:hypothetical protein